VKARSVKARHTALREDMGGLITRRPLPGPRLAQLDPFLVLNHHGPQYYPPGNRGLPFGPHPHRGFETVTFIIDGLVSHRDSSGHESIIGAQGVQWMTAGRGLVHAEESPAAFLRDGGALEVLQLWINLPARLKSTAPSYTGLQHNDIPVVSLGNGHVLQAIAGEWAGQHGPVRTLTDVCMSVGYTAAEGAFSLPAPAGREVLFYVVRGGLRIERHMIKPHELVQFNDDGETISVVAQESSIVLYGHATRIGEPVVAHGPFVMNSNAEIQQAIADYRAGKMGSL